MTTDLSLRTNQSIMLNPADVVANATTQAKLLIDIVDKTKCYQVISGKKYLQVEAWQTIGAFNRVHAVSEWTHPIERDGMLVGYDAKVNLVNQDGLVVGSAIMPCYFTENACKGKEGDAKDKACKSAAQTFAESKAYRMNYSYVAILAGYEPTPAEEMTTGNENQQGKPEHWCSVHNTEFFKKGKMKNYAHPIGETGQWCNEGDVDQGKTQGEVSSEPANAPKQGVPEPEKGNGQTVSEADVLAEVKKHLPHYKDVTIRGWLVNIVKLPEGTEPAVALQAVKDYFKSVGG